MPLFERTFLRPPLCRWSQTLVGLPAGKSKVRWKIFEIQDCAIDVNGIVWECRIMFGEVAKAGQTRVGESFILENFAFPWRQFLQSPRLSCEGHCRQARAVPGQPVFPQGLSSLLAGCWKKNQGGKLWALLLQSSLVTYWIIVRQNGDFNLGSLFSAAC